ncbi:MAG: ribosome biogenesis GTP-binding protein YihA/YsxC [Thermodesulfobacteriota bacterium]
MARPAAEFEARLAPARFVAGAAGPRQFPPAGRPEVAFAGRSNVGKSSLLNCLLNRRGLARTSKTPGRTQQINFFDVADWLYFVDLPGFGYAHVPLKVRAAWRPLVESYLSSRRNIRLVVLLVDIRRDPGGEERDLLAWLRMNRRPSLIVATKADKIPRGRRRARLEAVKKALDLAEEPIVFSSVSGEGREALRAGLFEACAGPEQI